MSKISFHSRRLAYSDVLASEPEELLHRILKSAFAEYFNVPITDILLEFGGKVLNRKDSRKPVYRFHLGIAKQGFEDGVEPVDFDRKLYPIETQHALSRFVNNFLEAKIPGCHINSFGDGWHIFDVDVPNGVK